MAEYRADRDILGAGSSPTWWILAASASPATAPLLAVKLRYGPRSLLALFCAQLASVEA